MCGIAGIVRLDGAPAGSDPELVRLMCDVQAHRGPDDSGVHDVGSATLGAVRLSIIDLSPAGHMPMSDASGRWWITYNGEVYNHRELRTELEALGHAFRSETDTEVVLHAFMQWGVEGLQRIAGMYAFAVYDSEADELTLVRDRIGIKPLYFARRGERFLFASEVKGLVTGGIEPALDARSFSEWTLYQSIDAPSEATLFEGVRSVLPGHYLRVDGERLEQRCYWSPTDRVDEASFRRLGSAGDRTVVDEVASVLETAVSRRLMSDVPVGTLLSGGLDSCLVTALAAQERPITCFHVSIGDVPGMDERPHAEKAAEALGLELVTETLDGASFRRGLPHAIAMADFPLMHANSVAYHLICKRARERGVYVLLTGEGADELFGGYEFRYRRMRTLRRLKDLIDRMPRKVRKGLELLGFVTAGLPVQTQRFDELLPQAVDLLDLSARETWRTRCEEAYAFVDSASDRALLGAMLSDTNDYLSPLLRRLDSMSMATSVEARVPFLDHEVVEKAIDLPLEYRVGRRADKWILREIAGRHLPPALAGRKKMGFPLPMAEYLTPFANPAFFEGGFWLDSVGLGRTGLERRMAGWRRSPFAFMALVSGEIWGRLALGGQTVDDLVELVAQLEHDVRT
jgi:asparagine synthase (glutamine-hydrolysing)